MGQKFVQSDYPTQSGTQYPANIDADIKVMARFAASYNPCGEDTPSALKTVVQAGAMFVSGALVANAAQTVTHGTADATNPRIDRVVIGALTGVASIIAGTPAGSPTAPTITSGNLPVAQVLITANMTIIGNSAITDERASYIDGSTPIEGSVASTGTTTITAGTISICTLSLGNVTSGDKIMFNAIMTMTKGVTAGGTQFNIEKSSGTATIQFANNLVGASIYRPDHPANVPESKILSGFFKVTVSGSLVLRASASSGGSNGTVNADDVQLHAMVLPPRSFR